MYQFTACNPVLFLHVYARGAGAHQLRRRGAGDHNADFERVFRVQMNTLRKFIGRNARSVIVDLNLNRFGEHENGDARSSPFR